VRSTWRQAKAPTLSCSRTSELMMWGGNRSGRVDMIWPTFTKVAPSAMISAVSRDANQRCAPPAAQGQQQRQPAQPPDQAEQEQDRADPEAAADEAQGSHRAPTLQRRAALPVPHGLDLCRPVRLLSGLAVTPRRLTGA
jgi:hypothetical protein